MQSCQDIPAEAALQAQQFLRLTAAGDDCAVRIDAVREILQVAQLTPLPLVPGFVAGVMNLRGRVVPVFDLGARVGLPALVPGRRSCIIVVEIDAQTDEVDSRHTLGLMVDAVHEVFDVPAGTGEPVPRLGTRVATRYLRQMVRSRGPAIPELDLPAILDPCVLAELIGAHVLSQ